jgi:hypothetical protein
MVQPRIYIWGVVVGVDKVVTRIFTRNCFTDEENQYAERLVGQLYDCKPITLVVSEEGIQKLHKMYETDDYRGLLKLARDETAILDKLWCVTTVVKAVTSLTMCLPSVLYTATTAYLYGMME